MSVERIAVTAESDNGLDSPASGHFGHCKAFIVSTVQDDEIIEVQSVPNGSHTSCEEPVNRLANLGVSVLITQGIGMKPFQHAQQVGLTVIKGGGGTAGEVIRRYIEGRSKTMNQDEICGGGDSHNH